jgi:hypothetical protein
LSGGQGAGGFGRGTPFGQRVPTATAPTAAVVSGAEKTDKAAGAKKTMADMSTKDKELCEEHNICKWYAYFGNCKFGDQCRNKHMPEKERKKKGLSFSARPEEKQPPDESSLVRELLNECCEITDAAPISDDNRGSGATFVSQFGFGFFSIDANTVFTDEDQQIFDQVNQERDAESVAEMRHDDKDSITALDYEDMPNGMMDNAEKVEAYNIPVAMVDETEANEMTLAMDKDSLPDEDVEASRTVIDEATEEMSVCLDIMLEELITEWAIEEMIAADENSWIEVPLRPAGEAQKERTGLLPQDGSEIFYN